MEYTSNFSHRLSEAEETHLFRIAQEALTNIARHSEAVQAWVGRVAGFTGQIAIEAAEGRQEQGQAEKEGGAHGHSSSKCLIPECSTEGFGAFPGDRTGVLIHSALCQ